MTRPTSRRPTKRRRSTSTGTGTGTVTGALTATLLTQRLPNVPLPGASQSRRRTITIHLPVPRSPISKPIPRAAIWSRCNSCSNNNSNCRDEVQEQQQIITSCCSDVFYTKCHSSNISNSNRGITAATPRPICQICRCCRRDTATATAIAATKCCHHRRVIIIIIMVITGVQRARASLLL